MREGAPALYGEAVMPRPGRESASHIVPRPRGSGPRGHGRERAEKPSRTRARCRREADSIQEKMVEIRN
jgi:hypothetical protein